jgi:hypothetical protein
MRSSIWLSLMVLGTLAGFFACSSDNADNPHSTIAEDDDDDDGSAGMTSADPDAALGGGTQIIRDAGPSTGGSTGLGEEACAAVGVGAQLTPLNLIFIYDKSGSMGDTDTWQNAATRWNPVRDGLLAFFSQPGGEAVFASLEFFPANGALEVACDPRQYETPTVPLLELATLTPETSPFLMAINATVPAGGTPTLPALLGSLNYARSIMEQQPDSITVVILLTDGLPAFSVDGQSVPGCSDPLENTVPNIATIAAEGFADDIPTYVIGIADDPDGLSALNQIALAGGTTVASIIVPDDPAATTASIQQELGAIREHHLECNLTVPSVRTESGELVDYDDVAVVVTVDGIPTGINRDPGCATGMGWQYLYDPANPDAPTQIELCQTTCQTVQGTAGVELTVEFPCGTVPW